MGKKMTDRYLRAFEFAFSLHRDQDRKGSNVPYMAHLMSVSALVLENGGTEDQAIAALLHDAVEDQGGRRTLDLIEDEFGSQVAAIVEGCTDSFETPKPAWAPRKTAFLAHLRQADETVLLVSLADKVHNARCILNDLLDHQVEIWNIFKGGKDGTLWYYRELAEIFGDSPFDNLKDELRRLVDQIEELGQ